MSVGIYTTEQRILIRRVRDSKRSIRTHKKLIRKHEVIILKAREELKKWDSPKRIKLI